MEVFIETVSGFSEKTRSRVWTAAQVFIGSLFLAACAQISIPFYPVPMTMHTFGVFVLALMQGGKKGFYSTLLYLAWVSMGLPFLSGGASQALWLIRPTAGYLFAFPIAAFVIGKIAHASEKPSSTRILMSVLAGQGIIYLLGVGNLCRFLSFEQSIHAGLTLFLPLAAVKLALASTLGGLYLRWKKRWSSLNAKKSERGGGVAARRII